MEFEIIYRDDNGIYNDELARQFNSKCRIRSYRTIRLALKPIKIVKCKRFKFV
jgi:hypothetical protein